MRLETTKYGKDEDKKEMGKKKKGGWGFDVKASFGR